jgi:hypothetical protein
LHESKSRLAYCFFLNVCSGAIIARSIIDSTVSHSSTEAEIKALDLAIKRVIWIRGFLKELGFEQKKPTTIYVDNISAKYLAELLDNCSNNVSHIIVILNYIQKEVLAKTVEIKFIGTDHQVADILTKPLAEKKFLKFRNYLLNGFNGIPPESILTKKRKRQL